MIGRSALRRNGIISRLMSVVASAALALAWGALAAWVLGRMFTDRWVWSQWLFWTPPFVSLGGAAVLLMVVLVGVRTSRGRVPRAGRRPVPLACVAGWAALIASVLFVLLVDWRLYAAPARLLGAAPSPAVRVLNWNAAGQSCPTPTEVVLAQSPDIVIMPTPPRGMRWEEITGAMGEDGAFFRFGLFAVASRYPVIRWGGTPLGFRGRIYSFDVVEFEAVEIADRFDTGWAVFVELDTTGVLGRPIVVWAIDLPSDPFIPRREMLAQARRAIDSFAGHVERPRAARAGPPDPAQAGPGFPEPDLVIGDFNTPRGSASLAHLVGGLSNAHGQGGLGRAATWPRRLPVYHIDQAFVGSGLRAARYRVIDPGQGPHRMQVVDVAAKLKAQSSKLK